LKALGRFASDQSASFTGVNPPPDRLGFALRPRHHGFAGEKVDVAATDAVARVPVVGDAADQKLAAAIDDRKRRRKIIAAPATTGLDDQRSLVVALRAQECGPS
jgi:hypothetical protein